MQIENYDETKTLLENMKVLFLELDDMKDSIEKQIKIKEAEQDDYLHEIELAKLNVVEMNAVVKSLKDVRVERRKLKDQLDLINTIKGFADKYINKGVIGDIKQVISNLESLQNTKQARGYNPKVIQNLKCAKKRED